MKIPDEIKKSLENCARNKEVECEECNYFLNTLCIADMTNDALEYINELEDRICELGIMVGQLKAVQPNEEL